MRLAFDVVEHRVYVDLVLGIRHLHGSGGGAGLLEGVGNHEGDILPPIGDDLVFKRRACFTDARVAAGRHAEERADVVMPEHQPNPAHTLGCRRVQ